MMILNDGCRCSRGSDSISNTGEDIGYNEDVVFTIWRGGAFSHEMSYLGGRRCLQKKMLRTCFERFRISTP